MTLDQSGDIATHIARAQNVLQLEHAFTRGDEFNFQNPWVAFEHRAHVDVRQKSSQAIARDRDLRWIAHFTVRFADVDERAHDAISRARVLAPKRHQFHRPRFGVAEVVHVDRRIERVLSLGFVAATRGRAARAGTTDRARRVPRLRVQKRAGRRARAAR